MRHTEAIEPSYQSVKLKDLKINCIDNTKTSQLFLVSS